MSYFYTTTTSFSFLQPDLFCRGRLCSRSRRLTGSCILLLTNRRSLTCPKTWSIVWIGGCIFYRVVFHNALVCNGHRCYVSANYTQENH